MKLIKRIKNLWNLSKLEIIHVTTADGREYSILETKNPILKSQIVKPAQIIKRSTPVEEFIKKSKEDGI